MSTEPNNNHSQEARQWMRDMFEESKDMFEGLFPDADTLGHLRSGPQSQPIDPEMFGTKTPRTFGTTNIQPFRWFPPRLPLSFFPSWIPPAVCSVCHSRRACDARYHITPHSHVNHVNRRLVIRARTRRAFGTT
jgi:hypothetical protein